MEKIKFEVYVLGFFAKLRKYAFEGESETGTGRCYFLEGDRIVAIGRRV